jgi:hypothetical protein
MMDNPYMRNIWVEMIGPNEAAKYLILGDTSHIDQQLVDQYAYDMQRGLWVYPGGIIEITATNKLKDGHHRLLAIQQSQMPQVMIVVRNVAENVERHY